MKKVIGIVLSIIIILTVIYTIILFRMDSTRIKTIKSDKELLNFYEQNKKEMSIIDQLLTLPFSILVPGSNDDVIYEWDNVKVPNDAEYSAGAVKENNNSNNKDYSKTNIQVEGVDEADIIKTDGDYIYSISEKKVIITNAEKPTELAIASTIELDNPPEDLLLNDDQLIVISTRYKNGSTNDYYWYRSSNDTVVNIYNIKDKTKPKLIKSFELYENYNTSRLIDGKLYIFSNGYLRKSGKTIEREYVENNENKEIKLSSIKYLNNSEKVNQTLIAEVNLKDIDKDIKVSSYLMDLTNSYVSNDSIYLLDYDYSSNKIPLKALFTLKGVFGLLDHDSDYNYKTTIYKFDITKNKGVVYKTNTQLEGETINQYSMDEKDKNLRIALESNDGTRIVVLDKNLKVLGETGNVAKGEKMYSSRFMGDKAYLVTFKNTDPLFAVDLSNPKKPKVLGKLEIPGYSTYLHPYDDTHIIGIGMDTTEIVNRDYNGKIISTWTRITGMKMALFDVSDMTNPKEIDSVKIGDSRTASAILTNPKALLFSKEKNLLAIPVNNYEEDFVVTNSESIGTTIDNYTNKKDYVAEGYLVYNINKKGFKLKGQITHENINDSNDKYSYYYKNNLLRGLYIDDDLFTVSEKAIKVNKIKDLEEIFSLSLEGDKVDEE